MKTVIYLVRHGEVHNPHQVVYGRLPGFVLSEQGKKEAELLGHRLKGKKIAAIYASPLTRAQETASYIAKHFPHLSVITDERIIEVASPLDGKPNSFMFARGWDFYSRDLIDAGGESLSSIWRRMNEFLKEILAKHAGQEVVAVSHGDPIMIAKVKHEGKHLALPSIRGKSYVGHAQGFTMVFESSLLTKIQSTL